MKVKKIIIVLYIVVVAVMAAATIIEKYQGTAYVSEHIYGAWWFSLLWGLLAAAGIWWMVKQLFLTVPGSAVQTTAINGRRFYVVVLHLSFVIILLGALLTHLTARRGAIHLREGETTNTYVTEDMVTHPLPFSLRLDRFDITYHEGTQAPADYASHLTITPLPTRNGSATHTADGGSAAITKGPATTVDGGSAAIAKSPAITASVSMNRIASYKGYRLYQSGYDPDGHGTILALNSDPWGIPVTYCGYALLFFALIWMLVTPHGTYRQLLRSPLLKKGAALSLLLVCSVLLPSGRLCSGVAAAPAFAASAAPVSAAEALPPTLPAETAARFGRLNMLYNDRICPVQTYALDFTKKLCGSRSYKGLTAEQVLTGFIFWPDEWRAEPVIKVKGGALKDRLQLPDRCSVNLFFNPTMGGYILGPYIEEYYGGNHDAFHKDVAKMDDRLMLIMELSQGTPLRLFPYTAAVTAATAPYTATTPAVSTAGLISWSAPTGKLPADIDNDTQLFMRHLLPLLTEEAHAAHFDRVDQIIQKLEKYQQQHGGSSIPSATQLQAEYLYNKVPFATILFMLNLTLGFFTLGLFIYSMRQQPTASVRRGRQRLMPTLFRIAHGILLLVLGTLTLCLVLRWIITGHVPMANGYETMLTMAWFVIVLSLIAYSRFPVVLTFGFLLSGFFLLVSHINQMDPQIGHLMPVLNSPLLSIHVSVIMMAFALLALTFICGVTALCLPAMREQLQLLSRLFLYPALTTLGLGIFIGAIWANISWGTYWSWDPKETWALITFMVYAVVVHTQSIPVFRHPLPYHIYMTLAFLTILMTYFGVNYFLGGMHSYA